MADTDSIGMSGENSDDLTGGPCPAPEVLAAYVADEVSPGVAFEVEEHLASCEKSCVEAVIRARHMRSIFTNLSNLTRLNRQHVLAQVAEGLAVCQQTISTEGWLKPHFGKWIESVERMKSLATQRLSAVIQSSTERVAVTLETFREWGVIVVKQIQVAEFSPIPLDKGEVTPLASRNEDKPGHVFGENIAIQLTLSHHGTLLVAVKGLPKEAHRLAVVIMPKGQPEKAKRSELRELGDAWIAHFEKFEPDKPGEFTVVSIEPLSAATTGEK